MFKNILFVAMVGMLFLTNGCASYLSYKASKNEIAQNRIAASGDKDAIRAVNLGVAPVEAIRAIKIDNGVGISVDISNLDALTEHPLRQLGAALLDAALTYGAYQGIQSLNAGGDSNVENINTTLNVNNADHTSVTVDNSHTTTTTTSTTSTDSHSGNGNNR